MEKLKLTVQEAVETLLMSQSSVYAWIDKGKLRYEEYPTGKFIVISKKEVEEIKELNLKSRRNKVSKSVVDNSEELQEIPAMEAEYSVDYEEKLTNYSNTRYKEQMVGLSEGLVMHITKLAEDAGKLALLEDLSKTREADLQYWKDNYHEAFHEKNRLLEERITLKETLSRAQLEVEALNKQVTALKKELAAAKSPVSLIRKMLGAKVL